MNQSMFDAARAANWQQVQQLLAHGFDVRLVSDYGFTALQYAAMSPNYCRDDAAVTKTLRLLIDAGSDLEASSPQSGARTALYLAAEFSHSLAPVTTLIEAGANANIRSGFGRHIVNNARHPDVQRYLCDLTGEPIAPPEPVHTAVKMNAAQWRAAEVKLSRLFDLLRAKSIVCLHDAGTTQQDGFSDGSEAFQDAGGSSANLLGFCFYTRQDLNRAKRSSELALAYWAAPEGQHQPMLIVGKLIIDACEQCEIKAYWDGSPNSRPSLFF